MANAAKIIKALGRWGKQTAERHREHVELCNRLEIEPSSFEAFASDVFGTPEDKRDWLLTPEPLSDSAPFTRFRQYESPLQSEIVTGLFYRDYRGRKR